MVDANNAYRHYQAIEFARKAEQYDLFWFEEPVEPDDYIGQAEITRATSVPVAAGENEYTRYGFRDMINARAVDILQPDALILGGITEYMKVAALAQANDLDVAPHGAQEVHIHLVAAVPNGLILEYYRDSVNPMHGKVWENELTIKDGYVYAPDLPGLGLKPKWDTLAPYKVG
jgi:D-arabinonate dehydratase